MSFCVNDKALWLLSQEDKNILSALGTYINCCFEKRIKDVTITSTKKNLKAVSAIIHSIFIFIIIDHISLFITVCIALTFVYNDIACIDVSKIDENRCKHTLASLP